MPLDSPREFIPELNSTSPEARSGAIAALVTVGIPMLVLYLIGGYLVSLLLPVLAFAKGHTSLLFFQILFVAIILAISSLLYALRTKRLRLYAALEIMFGVCASVFAANGLYTSIAYDTEFRNFVAAFGGIYIIVRGLDNWYKQPAKSSSQT